MARLAAAALLAAAAAGAWPLPWRAPFADGDTVRFQGTVVDPAGRPIADLEVALEASEPRFDWRSFRSTAGEPERRVVRTDERGQFAIDWAWRQELRHLELVATVPVRLAGRDSRRELARVDVTDRLTHGSPVSAALVVEEAAFVERLRAFVSSLASDDERSAYAELGLPESVDRVESSAGVEASWWYFAGGRVVRFRDGLRIETGSFPPIRPVGEETTP